jgi:hypothetical protein
MVQASTSTYSIPALSLATEDQDQPAPLNQASRIPLRALVRNLGLQTVLLAYVQSALYPEMTSEVYELPPGASDVLVIPEGQVLYAMKLTLPKGKISIALSPAWPTPPETQGE